MFCSECGAEAGGKFCWKCGSRLTFGPAAEAGPQSQPAHVSDVPSSPPGPPPLPGSSAAAWHEDLCYERLIAIPEVRDRIAKAAGRYRAGISGEQFLALFDAIVPTGVSLQKLCVALQPMTSRLGLKTGKSSQLALQVSPGRAAVAVLCSFAAHGHSLKNVQQAGDGIALQAVIPSSLWSLTGELSVSIQRHPAQVGVTASTQVAGQLFDWGHSQRLLDRLFDDIRLELSPLNSSPTLDGRRVA